MNKINSRALIVQLARARSVRVIVSVLLAAAMAAGCSGPADREGPSDLQTVLIWHYYNGVQKETFDGMVTRFNQTVGKEKGIVVQAFSHGSVSELEDAVENSLNEEIGSEELPDLVGAYADTAYELAEADQVADLKKYFTEEELSEYTDAYIQEGDLYGDGALLLFPVAKSTEVLAVNQTDWEAFAAAVGAKEAEFSSWEGIAGISRSYYEWTDSRTPEPGDGKAFFGRDAVANYLLVGSHQLGHDLFRQIEGKVELDLDRGAMKRLWDQYYVPYVNGYYTSMGRFRSDDMKTGQLLACVISSSGVAYLPDQVTYEDGTERPIEIRLYPPPGFEGTAPSAVQQGAGMLVVKSDERKEAAAAEFLKWFTNEEQNLEFAVNSGYLPVKKSANDADKVKALLQAKSSGAGGLLNEGLLMGLEVVNRYDLYSVKPFPQSRNAREVLEASVEQRAKQDRKRALEMIRQGEPGEDVMLRFTSSENFEQWYEDIKTQLLSMGEYYVR